MSVDHKSRRRDERKKVTGNRKLNQAEQNRHNRQNHTINNITVDQTSAQMDKIERDLSDSINKISRDGTLPPNVTHRERNYETYKYSYYSGSQAKVFIGDVWVDDIITVQYTTQHSKEPIYSYASHNYDSVSQGQFIGHGSIAIAFREVGYLNLIYNYISLQKSKISSIIQKNRNVGSYSGSFGELSFAESGVSPGLVRNSESIDTILRELSNNVNDEFNIATFKDQTAIYEAAIWGDANGEHLNSVTSDYLLRADQFDHKFYNSEFAGIINNKSNSYEDAFNLLLTFGDIQDHTAEQTIQVLNDVHFTGSSMMVSPSGEPIAEVYNFFFRDINKSINKKNMNISKYVVSNDFSVSKDVSSLQEFLNSSETTTQTELKYTIKQELI